MLIGKLASEWLTNRTLIEWLLGCEAEGIRRVKSAVSIVAQAEFGFTFRTDF